MANIVTSGLVGYWNSKQGVSGTTWSDQSGNNVNLTFGGTGTHSVGANGVAFNGNDDYASASIASQTQFTIEFWGNASIVKNNYSAVSSYSSTTDRGTLYYYAGNASYYPCYTDSNAAINVTGTSEFVQGTNNHLAMTYNGTTLTLYQNGTQVSTGTDSNVHFDGKIYIGCRQYNGSNFDFFNGLIASVRVYNRVLSASEVSQNYSVGTAVGLPSGGTVVTATVSATGEGTVSDTTYLIIPSNIAATGIGTVNATSNIILPPSSVSATGEGDVTTSTSLITTVTSSVAASGVGAASVSPNIILPSAVSAIGQGDVIVSTSGSTIVVASVSVSGVGTASATSNLIKPSTVSVQGVGTASTSSQLIVSSSVSAIGTGIVTVSDGVIVTSSVQVNGVGAVVIMNRIVGDTINLVGEMDTTVILFGESDTMVVLLGEADITAILLGESDTTPNLSGRQNTFVTLGGEI